MQQGWERKIMLTSAYMPATEHETSRLQQAHWSSRAILGHGVGQRWTTTTCDTRASREKVCRAACFISSRRGVRRWNPSALAAYLPATGGGREPTQNLSRRRAPNNSPARLAKHFSFHLCRRTRETQPVHFSLFSHSSKYISIFYTKLFPIFFSR